MTNDLTDVHSNLQLALDSLDIPGAIRLVTKLADLIDIIEIGTPMIIQEGMRAVSEVKRAFASKQVLADLKIADAGEREALIAFDAGADIVTVLALAGDATVAGTVAAAKKTGRKVMADLLQVADPAARSMQLVRLGVHAIGVHTAYDDHQAGRDPLTELEVVTHTVSVPLFVAGGIGRHNIRRIAALRPYTIIVGGAILNSPDPRAAAIELRRLIDETQEQ